jgi:hypothetical protein
MYLLDSGDTGLAQLSTAATSVLTIMAMSTDARTLETWVPHEVVARRAGMSVASVKRALPRLKDYLKFARHRTNGIKVYRLCLPGLEPTGTAGASAPAPPAPAEPFDIFDYVDGLTEQVAGIAPDKVRAIVQYHWRENPNDYWRKGDKHSPSWLASHIGSMAKQYEAREKKPAASAPYSFQRPVHEPAWVPTVYPRKGEKFAWP